MRILNGHYTDKFGRHKKYVAEIPADWEELTAHQYAAVMQLLTFENAGTFTLGASLLSVLFGPKNWHILDNLPDDLLHAAMPLTNFIIETEPPVKNFFPKIRSRKKELMAPANDLGNIGFGEWCFAYQFYSFYVQTKDVMFLDRLIATLYRPADPDQQPGSAAYTGDPRERFNENLIEERARRLQDVEEQFKQAIFGWLSAAFLAVQKARPNAFPEPEKDEQGNIINEAGTDSRTLFTVFRELLGPKWGTADQLKYTNAMFVLDHMEEQQLAFNEAKETQA